MPSTPRDPAPTTGPGNSAARLRLVGTEQHPADAGSTNAALTPAQASTVLDPAQTAALLGITEDSVLIRQQRRELPARLTMAGLYADRLDDRF